MSVLQIADFQPPLPPAVVGGGVLTVWALDPNGTLAKGSGVSAEAGTAGRIKRRQQIKAPTAAFDSSVEHRLHSDDTSPTPTFFSFEELAQRWRCSRGTVYNRLRAFGAAVLDFAPRGRKGKKVVPAKTVLQMESRQTKKLA
jgi:hypothetical protein